MQAIVETLFDIVYLTTVITLGILMMKGNRGNKQYFLFGIMAVLLGLGDSFHLVPRAIALCTTGLQDYTVALGIGKWITSITMTVFYVILFFQSSQQKNDHSFRYMWLTIVLSFAFYIPVVLFADTIPAVGMLMIPKTCAYVWTVWIGYSAMKSNE